MNYSDKLRIKAAEAQGWTGPWRFGSTHLHGTTPDAEKPATGFIDDAHVPDQIDRMIKRLCNHIDTLSSGIDAVRALINESIGVTGLHLNGEIAFWESLEKEGLFWEWLAEFNAAEEAEL
jgi:hypothetical protein